jgi:hypothetical protein
MKPLMATFIRLTLLVAIGLVALFVAFLLLKVVFFAAVIAAVVLGGLFLYNLFRRRSSVPVTRL